MNQSIAAPRPRTTRHFSNGLGLAAVGLLVAGVASLGMAPAHAAEARVGLGTAESFSVLAGSAITNTGPSVLSADLGLAPGSAVTGFPPGTVQGTTHVADAVANQAQVDLTTAYNDAAGRSTSATVTADLAGQRLTPGVYSSATSLGLSGALTLDAQGDPNAVFIFKAGSTLTTGSNSSVVLTNGASACNVFWQVGSSATLGTGTQFVGTVLALTSATLTTGANVNGRILARNGAVTLDTNVITTPTCAAAPSPSPTPTPTATPTKTRTPKPEPSPTETSSPSGSPNDDGPVIPAGNPPTGLGGVQQGDSTPIVLFLLGGLAATGAVLASTLRNRSLRQR
ncbi:MAG: hypothetical protein JWN68_1677 [Nocardioides sp.]|jgi:hypothetical protein|uniref:ice-binding family protein n=1 Tax=Nocardioides sp. TaxID=35761 RepID=UPI00261158D0|nr:ice-binding family protein [Nocardioides sp.]MCW2833724.1 hypothetical protein [Nocardioides sp.]